MEKNNAIVKSKEKSPLRMLDEEHTLSIDVATEMGKGYNDIKEIIEMLKKDTRVDDILDEDNQKIGQRTHINPQLLKWYQEARHTMETVWKIGGGDLTQEVEKEKIKLRAKVIMEILTKSKGEREEMVEKWKELVSFKK